MFLQLTINIQVTVKTKVDYDNCITTLIESQRCRVMLHD